MAGPRTRTSWAQALALAGALTACGGGAGLTEPPHSLPAHRSSPASAEALVLRFRETGGLAGKGGPGALPDLSLYSTGRAVAASQGKATEYRLRPEALRKLLRDARAAGLGRSHTVGSDQIADAVVLEFTMDGARTRIVQPEAQNDPAVAFRKRLDPRAWAPADQAAPAKPYAPGQVAVLAGRVADEGKARTWPLAPLGKGPQVAGGTCTLAPAAEVPSTAPGTRWRSGGGTYSVALRPLLPDEKSCPDIVR
ncbi:hypothetical protein [Actinomadura fibrosa]|uniref:Lipoprotein n=1 Tax=Actinomadura fibrosa TaxID=111802 RepID=A0ABW2X9R4_9ACTN|nr:hypothetical protein [Actinomadura fibrosa]